MDHQVRLLFHELVDLPPGERQRILAERQIPPNVRAEAESLLNFDQADDFPLTACVSGAADAVRDSMTGLGAVCGPYRLVRLLGRGGMGAVYLGERTDGEIEQRVAIKLLRNDSDRPGWHERFLTERQLLASLNHPSIVHVLDAGRATAGRPYLVMEYVEGISIDVHASTLNLQERLRLFLRVCDGVSHAHRRLIIHRDLKPSNILVDASSQPKLLDFGIARLLDDGDATQTAERLLTPNYASPEQLLGVRQTTATDVYSLGAVLYKILTGRSPHESDTGASQAFEIVKGEKEIPAPSRFNTKLPADIDYILRKALRIEPEERYASVDAFAKDVCACLESRPVEARLGDTWYRTRKFVRRYWVPLTAAMLVIASLSAGLYIANRERMVAQQRFAQLRQLSNKVFDLDKAIRNLPGSTLARQTLVADSLEYLEGLAGAASGDLNLAMEIAQGYWRVGRIQGTPSELNLGERAKAEASFARASEFANRVLAAKPKDRGALYLAALIANDRMFLAEQEYRYADAVAHAHESAAGLDAFLKIGGTTEAERTDAAIRYGNIALTYLDMHLYDDAIPYERRSEELAETIHSARIPVNRGLIAVANARRMGDLEAALKAFLEARKAAEKTVYPNETMRINDLYGILIREGPILGGDGELNLGRTAEAIHVFQQAIDMSEQEARKDPHDALSRAHAARAEIVLANILRHSDPTGALRVYDESLRRFDEIPKSLPAQREHALALANSSYPLRSLGRPAEAGKRIQTALAILKDTKDYPAEQYYLHTAIYAVLCALADYEAAIGEPRRAIEIYEQLLNKVTAAQPSSLPDFENSPKLSNAYQALVTLYRRSGNTVMAESVQARRLDLWQRLDQKFPNNKIIRKQIDAAAR
jgi:serine/threonine protein kinase/tetratricopeptide (TPR) repeat protein